MRRAVAALVVLLAACSSGGGRPPLDRLALPNGYQLAPVEQGEPAAFRRQYRADAGATDVFVHRVAPPSADPQLVVVSLEWDHAPDVAELARDLADDVPIGGAHATRIAGHPAQEHEADATFQSSVLAVDGDRGVLVYGGTIADARKVAAAALGGFDGHATDRELNAMPRTSPRAAAAARSSMLTPAPGVVRPTSVP